MEEKKLYNAVRKTITLADGREIMIETGKLAKQADGSVVVKMGDTMLLGTVVAAKDAKPDTDFMPLQVEYKEKYAACGRYPGGFMKREGKANDSEILVARLIDRALRPLFPSDYHAEVYVTVNLISADKDIQPDALAGLAASAALAVSDIPFGGPISEVVFGQGAVAGDFKHAQHAPVDADRKTVDVGAGFLELPSHDLRVLDAGEDLRPGADGLGVVDLGFGRVANPVTAHVGDLFEQRRVTLVEHLVEVDLGGLHQLEEGRRDPQLEEAAVPVLGDRLDVFEDVDHGAWGFA